MSGVGAEAFEAAWADTLDPLVQFPAPLIGEYALPNDTKDFLQTAGLPRSAAPFLSFGPEYLEYAPMLREYGIDDVMVVGIDCLGNPIAVQKDGAVACYDHDFDFSRTYVNQGVPELAQTLLRFRDMISEAQQLRGEEAVFNGDIPVQLTEAFAAELRSADAQAVQEGSFWSRQLEVIEANRP